MSNARYLEIDSYFRNRNEWPESSDFVVPISQTGRKGPVDAVDPVSKAAPATTWVANAFTANGAGATLLLTVLAAAPGTASGTTTFILSAVAGRMQPIDNYYVAAMLVSAAPASRLRIIESKFLGTDGTNDRMQLTVKGSDAIPLGTAVTIEDPTDMAAPLGLNPLIFVPDGSLGPNAYPGFVIHNQTLNQTRPIKNYFSFTHLLSLDTSGSATSTASSGPISAPWLNSHTYSIRKEIPLVCTSLDYDGGVGNPITHTAFNLSPVDSRPNLTGAFLEVEYTREPATGTAAIAASFSSTSVQLAVGSSPVDDFYIGSTIRISTGVTAGQIQTITAYNGGTRTITVSPGFTAPPGVGVLYQIIIPQTSRRIVKYVDYRDSVIGATIDSVNFPASASDIPGFYNNLYIKIGTNLRLIQSYTIIRNSIGFITARTATVFTPFTAVPAAGTPFTITSGIVDPGFPFSLSGADALTPGSSTAQNICLLQFSNDNMNPFVYTGSLVSQQDLVCYEVELLNLVLPNSELAVYKGALIAFYPYVYVELRNVDASGGGLKNIIYSNNPSSTSMLFRAAIDDVPNPINSTFIKIDGDGAVQTIKFKPNDNLHFSVHMPNGELFRTTLPENYSPHEPNPRNQISAYFSLKRV